MARPEAISNVSVADSSEVTDAGFKCHCGKSKGDRGHVVQCGCCEVWQHLSCNKLSKKQAEKLPVWYCPGVGGCAVEHERYPAAFQRALQSLNDAPPMQPSLYGAEYVKVNERDDEADGGEEEDQEEDEDEEPRIPRRHIRGSVTAMATGSDDDDDEEPRIPGRHFRGRITMANEDSDDGKPEPCPPSSPRPIASAKRTRSSIDGDDDHDDAPVRKRSTRSTKSSKDIAPAAKTNTSLFFLGFTRSTKGNGSAASGSSAIEQGKPKSKASAAPKNREASEVDAVAGSALIPNDAEMGSVDAYKDMEPEEQTQVLETFQQLLGESETDDSAQYPSALGVFQLPTHGWDDTGSITNPRFKCMIELIIDASDKYTPIVEYMQSQTVAKIWAFYDKLWRQNKALQRVLDENLWHDAAAVKAIGGNFDIRRDCLGFYGVVHTSTVVLDWLKHYTGQGWVKKRKQDHTRGFTKGEGSLQYVVAGAKDHRRQDFVLFALWPENPTIAWHPAAMNLGEMHLALASESLPQAMLRKWLPTGTVLSTPERGLNVASPLVQNSPNERHKLAGSLARAGIALNHLKDSSDPEVVAIYNAKMRAQGYELQAKMAPLNYKPVIDGARRVGGRLSKGTREPQND